MQSKNIDNLITIQNTEILQNSTIVKSVLSDSEITLFKERLRYIREELQDDPYIEETLRVLPVGGFRSAIGSFWNAVVDDLRNKILCRSIKLFNKEMNPRKQVIKYDDFQDNVNDEMLIDGAYKIGVIDWEAHKILKQAKETRNIFDGHPKSSNPGVIKALSMIEDCVKYVLSQEYPPAIIDIDEYIDLMGTSDFSRNKYSVSDAISDLPDIYKKELINRFFSAYISETCSSILRSSIEFVAPFLWRVLPKIEVVQVTRRIDQEITKGNTSKILYAFKFINIVGAKKYLTTKSKKYLIGPIIDRLNKNLDEFSVENECITQLSDYAGYIPRELLSDYVKGITRTYVGHIGGSAYFSRTDFYADGAASLIPDMLEKFDDESAYEFIQIIKTDSLLKSRIRSNSKLRRLRTLGEIIYKKISSSFTQKKIIEALIDEQREKEFFDLIK